MPNLESSQNISRQIQLNAELDLKREQRRSIFSNSKFTDNSPCEISIQEQGFDNINTEDTAYNTNSGWLRQSMYKQSEEYADPTLFEQYVLNPPTLPQPKEKKK